MRLVIDQARCEGHAMCSAMAPDDIVLDDDDRPRLLRPEVLPEAHAAAIAAVRSCPVAALSIGE